jgi:CO dehydrogenase maturation factor
MLLVVVEPGLRSLHTALQTKRLANDIGLKRIFVVANKISDPGQLDFIKEHLHGLEVIYSFPFSQEVMDSDASGRAIFEAAPAFMAKAKELKQKLEALASKQKNATLEEVS